MPEKRTKRLVTGVAIAMAALAVGVIPAVAAVNDPRSAPTNLGGTGAGVFTDASTTIAFDGSGYTVAVIDGAFYPDAPAFAIPGGGSAVIAEYCIGQISHMWGNLCAAPTTASRSQYPWETRSGDFLTSSGSNSSKPSNGPGNTCTDPANTIDGFCQATHGTQTAAVAAGRPRTWNEPGVGPVTYAGVAPGARLALYKVGGGTGTAPNSGWPANSILDALSMIEATARNAATGTASRQFPITAVSISTNGAEVSTEAACVAGTSGAQLDAAAARLKQYGIAVFMASGNAGKNAGTGSLTCGTNVISVGATEITSPTVPTGYTNLSTNLDLLAPVGTATCPNCLLLARQNTPGLTTASGTSYAAPQAAGAFAVLRQKYGLASVDKLIAILKSSGRPLTGSRAAYAPTARVINLDAALDTSLPWQ